MISDSGNLLLLRRDLLPDEPNLRARRLRRLFPDHATHSVLVNKRWAVALHRPTDFEHFVDEHIQEGLSWWSSKGLAPAEVPLAVRHEERFQLSLHDSWTLLAWSQWLAARAAGGTLPDEILILHVDQHDDLESPHLWSLSSEATSWVDALTGKVMRVNAPVEVAAAIESGAVGIASWMAPFLFAVPFVHLHHLRATARFTSVAGDYRLERALLPDCDLDPSERRPALRPVESDRASVPGRPFVDLRVALDRYAWLRDVPRVPTLLHIDCDYFNNRYDGNADWRMHRMHHDPTWPVIKRNIDELFSALEAAGVFPHLVDVTVALSPGFFPAELWAVTVERLRWHIAIALS